MPAEAAAFDAGVAVATVDADLRHVMVVAERDRLLQNDAFAGDIAGVGQGPQGVAARRGQEEGHEDRCPSQGVRAAREDLRHKLLALSVVAHVSRARRGRAKRRRKISHRSAACQTRPPDRTVSPGRMPRYGVAWRRRMGRAAVRPSAGRPAAGTEGCWDRIRGVLFGRRRMKKRLERVQSPQLGRAVSLWSYGHWGPPLVVFPTAAGFAHEWEAQGMVEALAPWLEAGKLKLYCPESNVAEAWTKKENDAAWRIQRHDALREVGRRDAGAAHPRGLQQSGGQPGDEPDDRRGEPGRLLLGEHRAQVPGDLPLGAVHERPLPYDPLHRGLLEPRRLPQQSARLCPGIRAANRSTACAATPTSPWSAARERSKRAASRRPRRSAICSKARAFPHDRDIWGYDVAHNWAWWKRQAQYHLSRRLGAPR